MTAPGSRGTWVATEQHAVDQVSASMAAALHELLDAPGQPPAAGDLLPPLWHWLAFRPRSTQAALGADGHPATGGSLPPTDGRRRMAAGGQLQWRAPLRVEEPLQQSSQVSNVQEKAGRSGSLLFVTVHHTVAPVDPLALTDPAQQHPSTPTGSQLVLTETSDIVYLTPAAAGPRPRPAGDGPPAGWQWSRQLPIDPTVLFRFSALTYNAHRIHYDRDYATGVEGYPGLVVHGPLQAVLLAELVRTHLPAAQLTGFTFRSLAPAFDDGPLTVQARITAPTEDGCTLLELGAFTHHGTPSMTATARIREPR
jgi:3-methylfumaryl-CoA hydratase